MNHSVDLERDTSDEMIPVREDGRLDIKFIKKLPFEDFIEVKNKLAHEQVAQLYDTQSQRHVGVVKGVLVDYAMYDEIDWGFGIDFKDFLRRMNFRLNKAK